jgi:hypothetical protein
MARKKKESHPTAGIGLHGFYRVALVDPDGTVAGDTGVQKNLIVSGGLTNYLTYVFAASAGSSIIGMAALGSGNTLIVTNSTIIPGAVATGLYKTVSKTFITRAASSDGDTARYLGIWNQHGEHRRSWPRGNNRSGVLLRRDLRNVKCCKQPGRQFDLRCRVYCICIITQGEKDGKTQDRNFVGCWLS